MKINSINSNKTYKPITFRNNNSDEKTTPVQTLQGPAPADILQFKQSIKATQSPLQKMINFIVGLLPRDEHLDLMATYGSTII